MNKTQRIQLSLALVVPVLGVLACQALLAPDEFWSELEGAASPSPTPTVIESGDKQGGTRTVEQPPSEREILSSDRLTGLDLPELEFGPVSESPSDPFRPRLSGEAQSLDTEHFRLHYTLSGDDSVPLRDSDENGHPDYVEDMAIAFEYSWFAEVEHFGWSAPPADEGAGGNDLYDVYLQNIYNDGTAAYAEGGYLDTIIGDNPNSEFKETRASHSFITMDNDYEEYARDPAPGISPLEFMRSTAAHELHHAIQYGYDSQEAHDWLWEASATWMQDEVFDQVNDGSFLLSSVFKSPDSCQLAYGGEDRVEDSDHWYGLWIFIRYLSEQYGHESVRQLWELTIDHDGYEAWDELLTGRVGTLEQLFTDYSIALLNRDFEEGDDYPLVRLEGEAYIDEEFQPVDGVAQMGADYVEIIAYDNISVALDNPDLSGVVVGILSGESYIFPLSEGSVQVDTQGFERVYLVVTNLNRASSESSCRYFSYTVTITPADSTVEAQSILPAPNFLPPVVEGLLDPDDYFDER